MEIDVTSKHDPNPNPRPSTTNLQISLQIQVPINPIEAFSSQTSSQTQFPDPEDSADLDYYQIIFRAQQHEIRQKLREDKKSLQLIEEKRMLAEKRKAKFIPKPKYFSSKKYNNEYFNLNYINSKIKAKFRKRYRHRLGEKNSVSGHQDKRKSLRSYGSPKRNIDGCGFGGSDETPKRKQSLPAKLFGYAGWIFKHKGSQDSLGDERESPKLKVIDMIRMRIEKRESAIDGKP
jgi:hypothetical protein